MCVISIVIAAFLQWNSLLYLNWAFNLTVWREIWQFCRTLVHVTRLNKHTHTHTHPAHTQSPHWAKVQQLHTDACKQLDIHMQRYKGGSWGGYFRTFCTVGMARLTLSLSRALKKVKCLYTES